MINITISYGLSNSINKDYPDGTVADTVIRDRSIQNVLGSGENVAAKRDGQVLAGTAVLQDGDELELESRAHTKALLLAA